jgi:hypothetical protein
LRRDFAGIVAAQEFESPMEQDVRFGSYRFDSKTGQLWCGTREVRLTPKAAAVLNVLELAERVFARGWGKRDWVEHDPDYDILRDDPRFKKLLANLK